MCAGGGVRWTPAPDTIVRVIRRLDPDVYGGPTTVATWSVVVRLDAVDPEALGPAPVGFAIDDYAPHDNGPRHVRFGSAGEVRVDTRSINECWSPAGAEPDRETTGPHPRVYRERCPQDEG